MGDFLISEEGRLSPGSRVERPHRLVLSVNSLKMAPSSRMLDVQFSARSVRTVNLLRRLLIENRLSRNARLLEGTGSL